MIADALRSILGRAEFAAGLRWGLVAFGAGLALALARRDRRPVAAGGLLFAAAFSVALGRTLGLPGGLVVGLVVLGGAGAAAGVAAARVRVAGPVAWLLAMLGAWLVVSRSGLRVDRGVQLLVGGAIVLGGWLAADFDARWRRRGLGPVLLAASVAGVYSTVPDTELALLALGAALPLALLGWPWPLASLGPAGAYTATGVLLWVVAAGSGGRGSAVVGGVACLGLLAVEPVARLLDPDRESVLGYLPNGRWGAIPVTLLHLGLVYVAARVAGLRPTVAAAVAIVLVEFAVAVLAARWLTAARRRVTRDHPM